MTGDVHRHDGTTCVAIGGARARTVPVVPLMTRPGRSGGALQRVSVPSGSGGAHGQEPHRRGLCRLGARSRRGDPRQRAGPGHLHLRPSQSTHPIGRAVLDGRRLGRGVVAALCPPCRGCPPVKSGAAGGGPDMRRTGRGAISDDAVAEALSLIERAQVAEWLEAELLARQRRPGRPRAIGVKALLCALLLLAADDRPLHLSGATEVLFMRLSAQAQATLGVEGRVVDRCSFLARYRQLRYLFGAISKLLDPSGLIKNRRLPTEEFTERCVAVDEEEMHAARGRLEAFMGALLCASAAGVRPWRAPTGPGLWARRHPGPVVLPGTVGARRPVRQRSRRRVVCQRRRPPRTRRPQGPVARTGGLGPRGHGADHGIAHSRETGVVSQPRHRTRPRATGHRPRWHRSARPAWGALAGMESRTPRRRPGLFDRICRGFSPPGAGHGLRPRARLPRRPARAPGQQSWGGHGRGNLVLPVDAGGLGQRHHRSAGRAHRRFDLCGTDLCPG